MEIKVRVSQASAVKRGELSWGDVAVVIETWEGWTPAEREELAGLIARSDDHVRADIPPTLVALHALCGDLAVATVEKAAEAAALALAVASGPAIMPDLARAQLERGTPETLLVADYRALGGVRLPVALSLYFYDATHRGEIRGLNQASDPNTHTAVCAVPPDVSAALEALIAQRDAMELAKRAEAEAAREAARNLELARTEEQLELLLQIATDEQRARMNAGFLGDEERVRTIRDAIFAPLAEWRRFAPLAFDDGLDCEAGDNDGDEHSHTSDDDVCYTVSTARELSANEFARFKKLDESVAEIKAALPEATVALVPRRHRMTCARHCCSESRSRVGIVIEVRLPAGSQFSREFGLDLPDECDSEA